jgi:adenylate cyclase class 2
LDTESEAKFYVRRPAELEKRLRTMGARLIQSRTHELNLRFDTPARDLGRAGRLLRLRRGEAARLTFKGEAQASGGAVTRREIEFTVGDFDAARRLLESLGYEVVFVYEKMRSTYGVEGAMVMLDELPCGNFVEIEGPLDALRPLAAHLGLNWMSATPASYHTLFERLCEARQLRLRDLTFEDLKTVHVSAQDMGLQPAD